MHPLAFLRRLLQSDDRHVSTGPIKRRHFLTAFLVAVLCLLFSQPLSLMSLLQANAQGLGYTAPTLDPDCDQLSFSADGNPFALCPGPFPRGGNCVWWAWEQWHWLHYDLPLNWGNAADWISDAQKAGLAVGTQPRVGAIAVFPVADGVWAYSPAGHVAFVTWVSPDGDTFNVTYQNYGDPTPVHLGLGYRVSIINQPRYQRGQLRFIYFPGQIDPQLFARLPGVDSEALAQVIAANQQQQRDPATLTTARLALGLPPTSSDQEFDADFTGSGQSALLLYNRQQGTLKVLQLLDADQLSRRPGGRLWPYPDAPTTSSGTIAGARLVTLADRQVGPHGWGSDLDIRIGDFAGLGHAQILLYSRSSGKIQILSLGPDLQISQHITLDGWGPGWEVYTGRFDGQTTGLLLYNRFVNTPIPTIPTPSLTPTPFPTVTSESGVSPVPSLVPTKTPTPSPIPKPTPRPTATAAASPTPTPRPTATATVGPTPTATPRPTATATASPTPTPRPTPTPTATPRPTATPTVTPVTSPTVTPTATPGSTPSATAGAITSTLAAGEAGPLAVPNGLALSLTPSDGGGNDLGGSQSNQSQLMPNVLLVDFTSKFGINHLQRYLLSQDSWEIYVGSFVSTRQDGLFLYDRLNGQGRLISFDARLQVVHNQAVTDLDGNWQVYSGDFCGTGQAQLLLYDPIAGEAQLLILKPNLQVQGRQSYSQWESGAILYTGHFGGAAEGIMLYSPLQAQSTFIAFGHDGQITHQYTVASWDQRWQVLIGSFTNHTSCSAEATCLPGDDILVLNRQTGRLEQYAFHFQSTFRLYDNRVQAFLREGLAQEQDNYLKIVDTSTFSLLAVLDTPVHSEELY
ncbi:hypothetical protein A4R35_06215 [Thermogemmatispora tikiterensis]|uniref:Peptidase C51 domain-containing protein n=1 Tax=Thermogemmatispora tikiterensis TaxID=1825093 RepID=A0A328VHK4_9CHLR|nr:hypothetical protein A4R35_06215 [Thermogemmatispora tikiterensis]